MASPASIEGRRAAAFLRVQRAAEDRPEPNRAERRAIAKATRKAKRR